MGEHKRKPDIRFQGFHDDWEQRKLGEIAKTTIGEFIIRTKQNPNSPYPVYNGGTSYTGFYDEFNNEGNKILVSARGANAGFVNIVKTRYWAGNSCYSIDIEDKASFDVDFIYQEMKRNQNRFIDNQQAANIPSVSKADVEKFEIIAPSFFEQNRIAAFFINLDNTITLHQRKYEKLTNVKKSMLEKMFPKNGSNVPEIRFKGFTDAWEQRKLGDLLVSLQNNTLSRADLSTDTGVAKNVHYGDVLIRFGEVLDVSKEQLPMISDESVLTKYKASFLQNGDVIVADTAEDTTVGKCSEIAGLKDEVVLSGLHTIPYRPVEKFATGYLGYYLNSGAYHNQLIPLMQGIKVTSISKSAMQDTDIIYPKSTEEQSKIGNYFSHLDHLITLHQRKLEKLKNIKKSMLEKMFV